MTRLERVAERLYSLPPAEFVAARNAAAADETGETAREIREFAKPNAAAWAINLLARDRSAELASLLELGAHLREAQGDLDRDALRQLTAERRTLIAALAKLAAGIAGDAGTALSAASQRSVEETLQAGLVDEAAGAALASGRLVRPLSSSGMDAVDLDGAVAGSLSPKVHARHPSAGPPPSRTSAREKKAERERAEAQRAAEAIIATAEHAAADLELARSAQSGFEKSVKDAAAEVDRVTEALARATSILSDAEAAARDASRAVETAERADAAARREAQRAKDRLDTLG